MTQMAVASSGVAEENSERTQLLDDIVLQIDEASEQRRLEREERSQRDRKLQEAGERIRERSIGITTNTPEGTDAASTDDREKASETTRKRTRRRVTDSDEEETEWVRTHLQSRTAFESDRARLEERRLDLDKEQNERRLCVEEKQVELLEKRLSIEDRRLLYDEKRLALETEERRGLMEERKEVLGVLSALVKKLH